MISSLGEWRIDLCDSRAFVYFACVDFVLLLFLLVSTTAYNCCTPWTVFINSFNPSDHTLSMDIRLDFKSLDPHKIKIYAKPKWSSCNVWLYKETVHDGLRKSFHGIQTDWFTHILDRFLII